MNSDILISWLEKVGIPFTEVVEVYRSYLKLLVLLLFLILMQKLPWFFTVVFLTVGNY